MRWPAQIQSQLLGAANAADRANRPTVFVVLPGALLVVTLVVLLVVLTKFTGARADLRRQAADWASVQATLSQLLDQRSVRPDLAGMFPKNALFDVNIENVAKQVWGPTIPVTIGSPTRGRFMFTETEVGKVDVVCTLRSVELDKLAQWIDQVLRMPSLRGVFLAKLELRPAQSGWNGQVVFRRYEYDPSQAGG